jgi:hypothetical protein
MVRSIGGHESLPKDQADAVVAKIASDMNRTSVPEVMKKLDQYVPAKAGTKAKQQKEKHPPRNSQNLLNQVLILAYVRLLLNQIESGNATNIQTDESKPACI